MSPGILISKGLFQSGIGGVNGCGAGLEEGLLLLIEVEFHNLLSTALASNIS